MAILMHPTITIDLSKTERLSGENPNKYTERKMEALRNSFKTYGEHDPMLDAGEYLAILKANQESLLLQTTAIRETEFYKTLSLIANKKDDDAVPDLPETPITQPGDMWEMGEHKILCADATDPTSYIDLMGGGKADLLLTDPPYGVSYGAKNEFLNAISRGNRIQTPIKGDQDKPEKMKELWVKSLTLAFENSNEGAAYYATGPQGAPLLMHYLEAFEESGWGLKHMLTWVKNNIVLGRSDYNYQHEPIVYGWKGTHKFYGRGGESSVWKIDKPQSSRLHPTMKPVELGERAIINSTLEGQTVLDIFAGAGFSLIASHKLKRIWRGMELSPAYVDVCVKRWENYTGQKAIHSPAKGGRTSHINNQ